MSAGVVHICLYAALPGQDWETQSPNL
jgi:hypothetical protein